MADDFLEIFPDGLFVRRHDKNASDLFAGTGTSEMETMSQAYYNEFDPFAAAWLRELIKAGLIAPGDVDERSIEDIKPSDLSGYRRKTWNITVG